MELEKAWRGARSGAMRTETQSQRMKQQESRWGRVVGRPGQEKTLAGDR